MYNVEETPISTVHNLPKIVAQKRAKVVGGMTSGERIIVTMIAALNSIGNSLPPLVVFPRVHFKEHMLKTASSGSKGVAAPPGWSKVTIFLDWLQHQFISHDKLSPQDPVIWVLYNYKSQKCRHNNSDFSLTKISLDCTV